MFVIKRLIVFLVASIFVFGIAKFDFSFEKQKEKIAHIADWVPFESFKGRFSALFPKAPTHAQQEFAVPGSSSSLCYEEYVAELGKGARFVVGYIDIPRLWTLASKRTILDKALETIQKEMKGDLLFSQYVKEEGCLKALDFQLKCEEHTVNGRLFLEGRRIFHLHVADGGNLQSVAKDSEVFFEGFSLRS